MTDEEKAEEYLHCNDRICRAGYLNKVKCKTCTRKQDFLAGLVESRKEKCLEQNKDGTIRPCEVMKENEQLKDQNTLFSTELIACNERCKDLEKENEKMNCCGNCKHYKQTNNYLVGTCKGKYYIEGNNICDKWELAE